MLSSPPATTPLSISEHANPADILLRGGFGPRVRRLHARIGHAHHQAEGMAFSRALLEGRATPRQLAALLRALPPAYALMEEEGPHLAAALGAASLPWTDRARSTALRHDQAILAVLPPTPPSLAALLWLERLKELAWQAPHRFMAHVYVRYGGDLSGGQRLAEEANAILRRHDLPAVTFWAFAKAIPALKVAFHDGFERMLLTDQEERELLDEAELAFRATQKLLAELESID
ncbi:MAG: biliverdin-producing heme oxygenase [Cyanobacteriota bacterium]